jgi:aquaporin Z
MDDDPGDLGLERRGRLGRGPVSAEPAWVRDPRATRHEWRRLFAEALGTLLLVLVAAGAPVVDAVSHGGVPLDAQVVAPGLMVMAIIYFMGMVSGAHLNPAVTLAFAARGNFPWSRVPGYIAAQLVGASVAALLLRALFGTVGHLGATLPGPGISATTALIIEALLTLGLVSVILGTASGARNVGTNAALAVGGYIALAGLWAAPISGASMNPARSFGPELIAGDWSSWWAYVAGPIAGALVAVGIAWILRGPPSLAADVAAQGETANAAPQRIRPRGRGRDEQL